MWQKEIEEILSETAGKPDEDWHELLKQMMPLVLMVQIMATSQENIDSPVVRQEVRRALAGLGLPPERIDEAINWLIMNTTKPIE